MKKKLLLVLGGLIFILVVLGLVAPTEFKIEREVLIQAPVDSVFSELRLLKNHGKWSPWEKKDPNLVKEYRGTDGTIGFVAAWKGNKEVGAGEQEIKAITEGSRIDYELRFKEPFEGTDSSYLITEPAGEAQTKVKWGFHGHSPFPVNILCLVMGMTHMMEKQFDEGLASLKQQIESASPSTSANPS